MDTRSPFIYHNYSKNPAHMAEEEKVEKSKRRIRIGIVVMIVIILVIYISTGWKLEEPYFVERRRNRERQRYNDSIHVNYINNESENNDGYTNERSYLVSGIETEAQELITAPDHILADNTNVGLEDDHGVNNNIIENDNGTTNTIIEDVHGATNNGIGIADDSNNGIVYHFTDTIIDEIPSSDEDEEEDDYDFVAGET